MGQQKHAAPVTRNDVHMTDKLDQVFKLKNIRRMFVGRSGMFWLCLKLYNAKKLYCVDQRNILHINEHEFH